MNIFHTQKHPLYEPDTGRIIGIWGISIDISDQLSVEQSMNTWLHQKRTEKPENFNLQSVKWENQYIIFNNQYISLSIKQAQIVFHITLGRGAKEIAYQMNISLRTVQCHIDNIKHKAGIYNKQALTTAALRGSYLRLLNQNFTL